MKDMGDLKRMPSCDLKNLDGGRNLEAIEVCRVFLFGLLTKYPDPSKLAILRTLSLRSTGSFTLPLKGPTTMKIPKFREGRIFVKQKSGNGHLTTC